MTRDLGFGEKETISAMLEAAKRPSRRVALRNAFVQRGKKNAPEPGVLATMVKTHDRQGLDLFLLHRMMASAEPWDAGKEAGVWSRALGLAEDDDKQHPERISRIWRRLDENYHLVHRDTARRGGKITSLLEDGSGEPYTSPSTHYFRLPFEYWEDGWHRTLSMPAKAVLLIALSRPPGFIMPPTKIVDWYGLSADTWSKGASELTKTHAVDQVRGKQRNWLLGDANQYEIEYTLLPPFNTREQPSFKEVPEE